MSLHSPGDELGRVLGTAPDPRDALAADEALTIGSALRHVPLPAALLPGWQSLCATEYGEALRDLRAEIALASSALALVVSAAR